MTGGDDMEENKEERLDESEVNSNKDNELSKDNKYSNKQDIREDFDKQEMRRGLRRLE